MKFIYKNNEYELIMICLTGSRMYGTNFEKGEHPLDENYVSDIDYRGVFISNPINKTGINKVIELIDPNPINEKELNKELIRELNKKGNLNLKEDSDIVLYEINKFFELGRDENPNILDIFFMDDESKIYSNHYGENILKNKNKFLSKNVIDKFVHYAESQLKRIKNHNKHINKFPKYGLIKDAIKNAYNNKDIDFNWINVNFSGALATSLTNLTQSSLNNENNIKSITREIFHSIYLSENMSFDELEKYMKPKMIDYLTLKDINGKKINNSNEVKYILLNNSTFSKITDNIYNIFSSENSSIFTKNGDIKVNEPLVYKGELLFHCSINRDSYLKKMEEVKDFWNWCVNRNEKRSLLEEKFGYDTKHASHLCRLMLGGLELSETGTYCPKLHGEKLKLVKNILIGKKTYEEVVELATKIKEKAIKTKTESCILPDQKDYDLINNLLIDIQKEFLMKSLKNDKKYKKSP